MSHTNAPIKSLVTGALGFTGRHLVARLKERGDKVLATDLTPDAPEDLGVPYLPLDVTNLAALIHTFTGVDVVFHVASLIQTRQADEKQVWDVNFQGTDNVIVACKEVGVKRLVYVSSASVVYEGEDIERGDETLPYSARTPAPYVHSKIEAEKRVLAAHEKDGLRTCALRPHVVFGPGDGRFLPAIQKRATEGRLRYAVGRKEKLSDFTYITNLIDALVLAEEGLATNPEVGGEAFFITNGEPRPFWDFVNDLLKQLDLPTTRHRVPFSIAYPAATVVELFRAFTGRSQVPEDGLTRFAIRYMCTHHYFSIKKARQLLGYRPAVSLKEGIQETVAHQKAEGEVQKPEP